MLKVAILEDNKILLKDLKEKLDRTGLVKVVAWDQKSESFIEKVEGTNPDALLLDIELDCESIDGIGIAEYFKLPTLFLSAKIGSSYKEIEELDMGLNAVVDHLSKPITEDKLYRKLDKFIRQIKALGKADYVYLDFHESKRNKIEVNSIVCLESNKNYGSKSNNKLICFDDRPPEIMVDFSFSKMAEKGLSPEQFITPHRSYRVNIGKILKIDNRSHSIDLVIQNEKGQPEKKVIPLSENFQSSIINKCKKQVSLL